ncbi:MAG: DUF4430 domain-containing protein [Thermoleophilia bacterium]|jgi:hypothetical protein
MTSRARKAVGDVVRGGPRRRLSIPLALIILIVAVTAAWIGLTLAGRSIEKPNETETAVSASQGQSGLGLQGVGPVDTGSHGWGAEYGKNRPQAVPPREVAADAPEGECTLAVSCHVAAAKGMAAQERWQHIVPARGVILDPVTVRFRQGESVFDVLKRELQARHIQLEFSGLLGMQYVKGIHNLYEFDGGPDSGWMYCVNGWYPHYGCGQYQVRQGDAIEWNYTCDLGRDLGVDWTGR